MRELRRELRRAGDTELKTELKGAYRESAGMVSTTAKAIVEVLTGRLQQSIRPSATNASGVVRAGSKAIPWAGPNHFGWPARGIEPNTFLYDAADDRASEVVDLFYERVEKIAEAVQRRSTAQ